MADENESYGLRLLNFWFPSGWAFFWLIVGLVPLFFFQTFIHESMHFLTAAAHGDSPTLIPFAHQDTADGVNLNGVTLYNTASPNAGGFPATPQIVELFLLLPGLILLFIFTSPPWQMLRSFLTWWYVGVVIDLLYNTFIGAFGQFHSYADWGKFAATTSPVLAAIFSWLAILLVLFQFGWIAFSHWHVNRPDPQPGFYDYWPLVILYAVLSLIYVIFAQTIHDPEFGRNGWFWAWWAGQLVALVWYLVYFGLVIWNAVKSS